LFKYFMFNFDSISYILGPWSDILLVNISFQSVTCLLVLLPFPMTWDSEPLPLPVGVFLCFFFVWYPGLSFAFSRRHREIYI
jgi:hypothetical protein